MKAPGGGREGFASETAIAAPHTSTEKRVKGSDIGNIGREVLEESEAVTEASGGGKALAENGGRNWRVAELCKGDRLGVTIRGKVSELSKAGKATPRLGGADAGIGELGGGTGALGEGKLVEGRVLQQLEEGGVGEAHVKRVGEEFGSLSEAGGGAGGAQRLQGAVALPRALALGTRERLGESLAASGRRARIPLPRVLRASSALPLHRICEKNLRRS
jgi:hypothetical protein